MLYTDIDADVDIWPETDGVGAPWTIADLGAAVVGWWNADDHGTANMVDDGGGLISSWKDRVSGVNPTATTTQRPTWGATAFNSSKAGVTGDGVANRLLTTTFSALPVGTTPGEIWILANNTSVVDNAFFMHYGAIGSTSRQVAHDNAQHFKVGDALTSYSPGFPSIAGNSVIGAIFGQTALSARITGNLPNPATPAATTLNTPSTGALTLFGYNSGAALFNACTIRQIIVTTALTIGQRVRLEAWLAWDGGIQASLPNGHPYRLVPPNTAWTPYDLDAAIAAWWSGDDHGTIQMTDDGAGLISAWRDRVGGLTPIGATTQRPTWTANAFNTSYAANTFNGTTNILRVVSTGGLPVAANSGELWGVMNVTHTLGANVVPMSYGNGGNRRFLRPSTSPQRLYANDGGVNVADTSVVATGPLIAGAIFAPTLVSERLNGAPTSPASIATTLSTTPTATSIGASSSGGNLTACAIRHMMVTTYLTPFQEQQFEGWAAWDSGLTANLPIGHPFKAAAPVRDWRPTDLGPALRAWWSADDHAAANMVDDGAGLISSWKDRIGGINLTAATTARPTWAAASFNSKAGVTGDGVANVLRTTTAFPTIPVALNETWIVANTSSAAQGIMTHFGSVAGTSRSIGFSGGGLGRVQLGDGVSTTMTLTAPAFPGNLIIGGQWNGTTLTDRVNGGPGTPASAAITSTVQGSVGAFSLFAYNTGAILFAACTMRHVFVTGLLTLAQQQQLEGWVAWDSGLTGNLPAEHPYKSVRP